MKLVILTIASLLLGACATPRPIVDTAGLVSKMSSKMDHSVTSYVDSLARVRQLDAERLQRTRTDAQKHRRSLLDEIKIMQLTDDVVSVKILKALTEEPAASPSAEAAASKTLPKLSFDSAPLKNVSKVTSDLAQPATAAEQWRAIVTFATQVNDDLNKAAAENKNKAGT